MAQWTDSVQGVQANPVDAEALVALRVSAMRESLEQVGRFDPVRVRERFLKTFVPQETIKLVKDEALVGFYVLRSFSDHHYLDHLYIAPMYQSQGLGEWVLSSLKAQAEVEKKPIRLGALRDSRANAFYQRQGFIATHEGEWDIYYQYPPAH